MSGPICSMDEELNGNVVIRESPLTEPFDSSSPSGRADGWEVGPSRTHFLTYMQGADLMEFWSTRRLSAYKPTGLSRGGNRPA